MSNLICAAFFYWGWGGWRTECAFLFFPKCCVIFRLIATLVPHQSFPGLWFPFQGIVYPEMSIFVIIYSPSTIYIVVVFVSALFLYYEVDGDLKPSFSDSICSMRSHNSTLFFTRVMFVDDLYKLAPIFGLQSACNFVSILCVNKENLVFSHH